MASADEVDLERLSDLDRPRPEDPAVIDRVRAVAMSAFDDVDADTSEAVDLVLVQPAPEKRQRRPSVTVRAAVLVAAMIALVVGALQFWSSEGPDQVVDVASSNESVVASYCASITDEIEIVADHLANGEGARVEAVDALLAMAEGFSTASQRGLEGEPYVRSIRPSIDLLSEATDMKSRVNMTDGATRDDIANLADQFAREIDLLPSGSTACDTQRLRDR